MDRADPVAGGDGKRVIAVEAIECQGGDVSGDVDADLAVE